MLPTDDHYEAAAPTVAAPFRMPESPSYHRDDYDTRDADFDEAETLSASAAAAAAAVEKVFTSTPPHVEEPALVQPPPLPKRLAIGHKQPKVGILDLRLLTLVLLPLQSVTTGVAKKPVVIESAAASKSLIAAQRKNQQHAAKRTAALEAEAEAAQPGPAVAQSTGRAESSKKQKDSGAPPPKQLKPATKKQKSAVEAESAESASAAKKTKTSKTKDAVPKTKDAVPKSKKAKKTRITFTPQSRHPGKRAPDDTRPRRAVAFIDDEAEDDDEDDDDADFDGDSGADDDEEGEEEDNVVAEEGGAVEMNNDDEEEEDDDDNATVAISNRQNEESDARLMSSTRPKPRGGKDRAAARRIAAIEFDSESDADAVTAAAAAAAASKSKRKKAADDESVATVEKNTTKSKRRSGVEHAPVGGDPYDIDTVLQKNAKKFKLVSRNASEPLTTVSVRKEVTRKARDGQITRLVYRLLHLDRTRRCAYSRLELMQLNKEGAPRIDMDNFLHFAAVEDGKYKMEDVMSFLVDRNGMMCACPRRTLLQLMYLDQRLDYAHFRDFYDKLPEYIDMNNDDKIPPVPPALYTSGEIRKSKRKWMRRLVNATFCSILSALLQNERVDARVSRRQSRRRRRRRRRLPKCRARDGVCRRR